MLSTISFIVTALALQHSQALPLPSTNHTTVTTLGIPTCPSSQTAQQDSPVTLILCDGLECDTGTEECEIFDLMQVTTGVCIPTLPFRSAIVSRPGTMGGLPFPVLIGPPGCDELDEIAAVNQCFPFGGAKFGDFLVVGPV